jgi:tetratricopeptide (TPR) repeat protein
MSRLIELVVARPSIGDLVFIHGLGGHPRKTWHVEGKRTWADWLHEDLPDLAYWSLEYEAAASRWFGTAMPLHDRAINALALLKSKGIGARPVYFITHSMGGLLLKQMLRIASGYGGDDYHPIADRCCGAVYLSTPHHGASVATFFSYLKFLLPSAAITDLGANAPNLRDLNLWYRNSEKVKSIRHLVFYETQDTKGVRVVDESSADPGLQGVIPIPVDADHSGICHPKEKDEVQYARTQEFLRNLVSPSPGDGPEYGPIIDCSSELRRHDDIVGRSWLTKRFSRILRQSDGRYILLVGGPGIGKTALVSELIRGSGRYVCYHFIVKGMGDWDVPSAIAQSLAAQLRRLFGLPLRKGDLDTSEAYISFHRAMQEASRKVSHPNRIVIFLDGLDEAFGSAAQQSQSAHPGLLPPYPPPGICIVLTSRPGQHLDWLKDYDNCTTVNMDPHEKENLCDIQSYLQKENSQRGLRLSEEMIRQLTRSSEGFFAAAVQYTNRSPAEFENWRQYPELIPKGLQGWIRAQWSRLLSNLPPELNAQSVSAVLGLVAANRGPLTRHSLRDSLEHASAGETVRSIGTTPVPALSQQVESVLRHVGEVFDYPDAVSNPDGLLRFYHTSFREFILEEVGGSLVECHRVLGEYYRAQVGDPRCQVEAFYQFAKAGDVERAILDLVQIEKYVFDLGFTDYLNGCFGLLPKAFDVHDQFFKACEHLIRGKVAYYRGRFERALDCFNHTFNAMEDTAGEQRFLPFRMAALEYRGLTFRRIEDFDRAQDDFNACLTLACNAGYPHWKAHALSDLGMLHREQGALDEAVGSIEAGIAARKEMLEDLTTGRHRGRMYLWTVPLAHVQIGDQYSLLAYCHIELRNSPAAQDAVDEAWRHFENADKYGCETYYRGRLLCASAFSAALLGKWEDAVRHAREAYRFPMKKGNRMGEIAGRYCLGMVYLMQGDSLGTGVRCYRDAIAALEKCVSQLEQWYRATMPLKHAKAHLALERAYTALGDSAAASTHRQAFADFARKSSRPKQAITEIAPLV